jgi:hypothetical protein
MQTSHCFRKSTFILLLLFAITLFPFSSCNNGAGTLTKREDCITITRGKIMAWLNAGWHVPGNANFVPLFLFDPLSGSPIKVDAYPTDKNNVVQTGKKVQMKIASGLTPPCSFEPGLFVVKNYYDFAANGFADASGNLINFSFLRLRPKRYPQDPTYLSFDVEIVTGSGATQTVTAKGETRPCPPYCPTQ